jgi:alkylresorcinol/alkylpyrone synthase
VHDYLRAFPDQVAVLVATELCSLTLQPQDLSVANLIASGLFGDGAAAVVLVGANRAQTVGLPDAAPAVLASGSSFYPDSEHIMGWKIGDRGFQIVLSAGVPAIVKKHVRADVDGFLETHGLSRDSIDTWVCHPGGPKVLEAMTAALELPDEALEVSWRSLREVGNLSSVSVLLVLQETLAKDPPSPGAHGLMMAMGPGFCSELVLLGWPGDETHDRWRPGA